MGTESYQDLISWQRAMELAELVYALSERFPKTEIYGITAQIRRSAVSVPSNIAEGRSRRTTREFLKGLSIAYGSLAELETQVQLAVRLHYTTTDEAQCVLSRAAELGRVVNGLIVSLRGKLKT